MHANNSDYAVKRIAVRRFVIDTVCVRLMRKRRGMFIATIHDSIVARKCDCDVVVDVFREEFAKLGVNPKLNWVDVAVHAQ
jgi:hypothetical protein